MINTNKPKSNEKLSTKDLILSSMTEGVIVLDKKSRVVIINDSAKSYLDLKNKSYSGKRIQDIVKIPKFVSFVKKLLKHDKVLIQELKIKKNPDKSFLVNGNVLKGKFFAEIKKNNIRSISAFKNAGFKINKNIKLL